MTSTLVPANLFCSISGDDLVGPGSVFINEISKADHLLNDMGLIECVHETISRLYY